MCAQWRNPLQQAKKISNSANEALEPVFLDAMGKLAAYDEVVPAPMRGEVNESAQPLDLAGTIRTDGSRVPAPMREDPTRNDQPLDRAWTTPKRCVANVVPAPRLELECGGGSPDPEE